MLLTLFPRPALIDIGQLRIRFFTPLFLCLLGLVILSNRPFIVRHLTRIGQNTRFHLPADDARSSHARRSFFLMEVPDDTVSDLQHAQRNSIGIKTAPKTSLEEHWVAIQFETAAVFRSNVHLFESVLNL